MLGAPLAASLQLRDGRRPQRAGSIGDAAPHKPEIRARGVPGTLLRPACDCGAIAGPPAHGAAGWSSSAWGPIRLQPSAPHMWRPQRTKTCACVKRLTAACITDHKLPVEQCQGAYKLYIRCGELQSHLDAVVHAIASACLHSGISAARTASPHLQSDSPPTGGADADVDHGEPTACGLLQHTLIANGPHHLRNLRPQPLMICKPHVCPKLAQAV